MASQRSETLYERDALRFLDRASAMFGSIPAIDALICESDLPHLLARPTARRYKPAYRAALNIHVANDQCSQDESNEAYAEICQKLHTRSATECELRTSALKIIPTAQQAQLTLRELGRLARGKRSPHALEAALFVLVVSRIAIRPVELLGATIEGKILTVKNAKRRKSQDETRSINLRRFPDLFILAVTWLIKLAEWGVAAYQGRKDADDALVQWRNALASCLARASEVACKKRLSLYAWRHIGIATWKAAGFTAAQIAKLAGHMILNSAERHYAPASKGLANRHALAEPVDGPNLNMPNAGWGKPTDGAVSVSSEQPNAKDDQAIQQLEMASEATEAGPAGISQVRVSAARVDLATDIAFMRDTEVQLHVFEIDLATSDDAERDNGSRKLGKSGQQGADEASDIGLEVTLDDLIGDISAMPEPQRARKTETKDNDFYVRYRKQQEIVLQRLDDTIEKLKQLSGDDFTIDSDERRKK